MYLIFLHLNVNFISLNEEIIVIYNYNKYVVLRYHNPVNVLKLYWKTITGNNEITSYCILSHFRLYICFTNTYIPSQQKHTATRIYIFS